MDTLFIKEFDYDLTNGHIAEYPLHQRDTSRLLIYKNGTIEDESFSNLAQNLPAGCTLVLNNTRVIEARLFFQKETGAQIEIFCLSPHQPTSIEEALNSHHECL